MIGLDRRGEGRKEGTKRTLDRSLSKHHHLSNADDRHLDTTTQM